MAAGEGRAEKTPRHRQVGRHGSVHKADAVPGAHQLPDDFEAADAHGAGKGPHGVAALGQRPLQQVPRAGAFLPQDEPLAKQRLGGYGLPVQRVARRADADVRLIAQQKTVVPGLVEHTLQHHKVQLTLLQPAQQGGGVVHQKLQLVVGCIQKPADGRA